MPLWQTQTAWGPGAKWAEGGVLLLPPALLTPESFPPSLIELSVSSAQCLKGTNGGNYSALNNYSLA